MTVLSREYPPREATTRASSASLSPSPFQEKKLRGLALSAHVLSRVPCLCFPIAILVPNLEISRRRASSFEDRQSGEPCLDPGKHLSRTSSFSGPKRGRDCVLLACPLNIYILYLSICTSCTIIGFLSTSSVHHPNPTTLISPGCPLTTYNPPQERRYREHTHTSNMSQIPLNAAASNNDNNRQVTSSLPPEVVQCLENARFVRTPSFQSESVPYLLRFDILLVLVPLLFGPDRPTDTQLKQSSRFHSSTSRPAPTTSRPSPS